MMKLNEFLEKLELAVNCKTLYVKGCFGAPLNAKNKERYINNSAYNKNRANMIKMASNDTFGFDCICLIKGILWGWKADKNLVYGGAKYASNGVPDCNEATMINSCKNVSSDFKKIGVGELLYMPGHVGVYVGNGKVIECTPACKNGAQITNLNRVGWKMHGYLPWVDYGTNLVATYPDKPAGAKVIKMTVTTAGGRLNVRDASGKVIGSLANKTKVELVKLNSRSMLIGKTTWVMAEIKYNNKSAFVAQTYLK